MPDDINKGELVRVIVSSVFQDQCVKVLEKNGRYYRLDTTYGNKPYPCWFERHEIEPVTPEVGTLHYGYEEWERGLPPMPGPKGPDEPEDRGVV